MIGRHDAGYSILSDSQDHGLWVAVLGRCVSSFVNLCCVLWTLLLQLRELGWPALEIMSQGLGALMTHFGRHT